MFDEVGWMTLEVGRENAGVSRGPLTLNGSVQPQSRVRVVVRRSIPGSALVRAGALLRYSIVSVGASGIRSANSGVDRAVARSGTSRSGRSTSSACTNESDLARSTVADFDQTVSRP